MGIFSRLFGRKNKEFTDYIEQVPVNKVFQNPYQPRRVFKKEEMEQLKKSIAHYGVLVPIVVRKIKRGYELACGERRLRACRELGIKTISVIVKTMTTPQMVELALIENLIRADMLLLEEAETFERMKKEFSLSSEDEIAERMGMSKEIMQRYKRLASLPLILKKALSSELITEEHAVILAQVPNEEEMLKFLAAVVERKLTPAELKEQIKQPV